MTLPTSVGDRFNNSPRDFGPSMSRIKFRYILTLWGKEPAVTIVRGWLASTIAFAIQRAEKPRAIPVSKTVIDSIASVEAET